MLKFKVNLNGQQYSGSVSTNSKGQKVFGSIQIDGLETHNSIYPDVVKAIVNNQIEVI